MLQGKTLALISLASKQSKQSVCPEAVPEVAARVWASIGVDGVMIRKWLYMMTHLSQGYATMLLCASPGGSQHPNLAHG